MVPDFVAAIREVAEEWLVLLLVRICAYYENGGDQVELLEEIEDVGDEYG